MRPRRAPERATGMRRLPPRAPSFGVLQLPPRSPMAGLLRRSLLAVGLILAVAVILWFNREGLRDNTHPDRLPGFVDVFYFTVVSLTTVGYGDIIPVTDTARLVNAVLLTPIRVFLWGLFLGTAYELVMKQYRERLEMDKLRKRLRGHTIVCGYGVKGRTIVAELLAHGLRPEEIVVIDPDEDVAQEGAAHDLVALRGDASSESILLAAGVDRAGHVLAAPNRDDACVLICLTVRTLAPGVRLIASAREEENIKLLYKAGADVVVSPSVSGGRLMAAAVRQRAVTSFLEDLLEFGSGVDAGERLVLANEAGRLVAELSGLEGKVVLGVARGRERVPFHRLGKWRLQPGDVVVYLSGESSEDAAR
jgi:voltage-gated potassium channel